MRLGIVWEGVLRDERGRVIDRHVKKSQSFVKNFMLLLRGIFLQSGQTAKDVNGEVREIGVGYGRPGYSIWMNYEWHLAGFRLDAPEGDDSYGIVVGYDNITVTPDDYALYTPITHGSEDGKLYYRACNVGDVNVVGNKVSMVISREFVNYGSTVVEVGEMGLVGVCPYTNNKFLIVRDTYSSRRQIPPNKEYWLKCRVEVEV